MRVRLFSRSLKFVLITAAILGGGCLGRSPSPTFYALTPVQDQYVSRRPSPVKNVVIGIGPVKLAEYLDESLIVTRTSANELDKAQFHRWAGSFKDNFTNVLADDIGFLLPTEQIYLYPWRLSVPIDYQVAVDVVRCDGRLGDAAYLEVRWSIFKGPEKKLLKMTRYSIREPVTGPGYAALVAAQSRAVANLGQEIATAIRGAGKS
ncbi:MAG: PqiC family protein [Deltaproteobacteria bacterium]